VSYPRFDALRRHLPNGVCKIGNDDFLRSDENLGEDRSDCKTGSGISSALSLRKNKGSLRLSAYPQHVTGRLADQLVTNGKAKLAA
jgi:hypothetical protein